MAWDDMAASIPESFRGSKIIAIYLTFTFTGRVYFRHEAAIRGSVEARVRARAQSRSAPSRANRGEFMSKYNVERVASLASTSRSAATKPWYADWSG